MSQSLTLRTRPQLPDTAHFPSGDTAMERKISSSRSGPSPLNFLMYCQTGGPVRDRMALPVATSQTRIDLSNPALRSCVPSAEKATEYTGSLCPPRSKSSAPEATSQILARFFPSPDARRLPSGEKATDRISPSAPLKV